MNLQFGGVVYNVELLDTNFHQDNKLVSSSMKVTVNNVMYVLYKYYSFSFAFISYVEKGHLILSFVVEWYQEE